MSNKLYLSGISAIASSKKVVELNAILNGCYGDIADFQVLASSEGYSFDKQFGHGGVFYIVSKGEFTYKSVNEFEVYEQTLIHMGII